MLGSTIHTSALALPTSAICSVSGGEEGTVARGRPKRDRLRQGSLDAAPAYASGSSTTPSATGSRGGCGLRLGRQRAKAGAAGHYGRAVEVAQRLGVTREGLSRMEERRSEMLEPSGGPGAMTGTSAYRKASFGTSRSRASCRCPPDPLLGRAPAHGPAPSIVRAPFGPAQPPRASH